MMKLNTGYAYLLANVASVEATGPLTLQIKLSSPDVSFLGDLGQIYIPSAQALQEHAGSDDGSKWFSSNEAGSGPYELVKYVPNSEIVLKEFPGYWGGWSGSHVKEWTIEEMDPTSQALNLRQGDITAADGISTTDLAQFDGSGYVLHANEGNPFYLTFNMDSTSLASVDVRQAIAETVPYDQIIKQVMLGHASRLAGPIPDWMLDANKSLTPVPTNLAQAKSLLAAAGYTPSKPLSLNLVYCTCLSLEETVATVVQASLAQVGVKLSVQGDPWPTLVAKDGSAATRPDIGVVAMAAPTPDSGTLLTASFDPANTGNWQYWGYHDQSVVDLLRNGTKATTSAVQEQDFVQAQQELYDQYASIWLMDYPFVIVTTSALKNVNVDFAVTDFNFYQAHF
jgi:peptide/nickel transport system substrate-binding protein